MSEMCEKRGSNQRLGPIQRLQYEGPTERGGTTGTNQPNGHRLSDGDSGLILSNVDQKTLLQSWGIILFKIRFGCE